MDLGVLRIMSERPLYGCTHLLIGPMAEMPCIPGRLEFAGLSNKGQKISMETFNSLTSNFKRV